MRHRPLIVLLVIVAGGAAAWRIWPKHVPFPEGISSEDYERARRSFERHYGQRADHYDILSVLGERAVGLGDSETALNCFNEIPSDDPRYGHSARFQQAQILWRLDRAREAEEQYREFLRLEEHSRQMEQDDRLLARQQLRHLLEVQLRFEERRELLRPMIAHGQGNTFDTVFYCFPSLLRWNNSHSVRKLEAYLERDLENFLLRVAHARYRIGQGRLEEAEQILAKCLRERSNSKPAQAAMLALQSERGDWDAVGKIVRTLARPKQGDPWLMLKIRGRYHNQRGEHEEAIRCYKLVIKGDPASAESRSGLARAYAGLNRPERRREELRKAGNLARVQNLLGRTQEDPRDVKALLDMARLCEEIGLTEQALALVRLSLRYAPENPSIARQADRLERALQND